MVCKVVPKGSKKWAVVDDVRGELYENNLKKHAVRFAKEYADRLGYDVEVQKRDGENVTAKADTDTKQSSGEA